MGSDTLFSPTDAFKVPAGTPLMKALVDLGLEEALRDSVYLERFLAFNKITNLNLKFSKDTVLLGHRADLIQSEDKHRMRSLQLFYFQFNKLGMEKKISELPEGAKVLDLGAGYGRALLELKSLRPDLMLTGIGLPGETIAEGINFIRMDLNQSILPKETFDLIYSRNTLRYLKRKDLVLEDVYRKLNPGGTAFVDIQLLDISGTRLREFFLSFPDILHWDEETLSLRMDKKGNQELTLDLSLDEEKSVHSPWEKEKLNHADAGWLSVYRRNP